MKEWNEGRTERRRGEGNGWKEKGEKNVEEIFRIFRYVDRLVHFGGKRLNEGGRRKEGT